MGDMDLPAGPPSRPGTTVSFLQPLQERERMSAEQRKRDAEEVDRFFTCAAPVVPEVTRQAIKNAICPQKARIDGELFTALRRIDNPDAKAEMCQKRLQCGHTCEEPKIVSHECGLLCSIVKTVVRSCGHETPIYCYRQRDGSKITINCKEFCGNEVSCHHKCREICHVNEPCPPTCGDFHCKNEHLKEMARPTQPSSDPDPDPEPESEW